MKIPLILALLTLTGCATTGSTGTAPIVTVEGPKFTPGQFDCGRRPIPPNPDKNGTGKAAAIYENKLAAWGQACSNKLGSVGVALSGAGQLAGSR